MLNLLKHEFFKFFRSFGFKLLIILVVGLMLFFNGLTILIYKLFAAPLEEMGDISALLNISGYNAIFLAFGDFQEIAIIIAIIAALAVVREFQQGTIKNTVMYNQPKLNIYIAKFILQIAAITVAVLAFVLPYVLLYNIFGGWGKAFTVQSLWEDYIRMLLMGLLLGFGVAAFVNFFAYLTKSTVLLIVMVIALSMIMTIFTFLKELLPSYLQFLGDLSFMSVMLNYQMFPTAENLLKFFLLFGLLFIPFSIGGYFIFRKAEIK